jgi:hypothetical protein
MMSAGASQSLIKMEAVETAKIPMGMRKSRETIVQIYINQDFYSSQDFSKSQKSLRAKKICVIIFSNPCLPAGRRAIREFWWFSEISKLTGESKGGISRFIKRPKGVTKELEFSVTKGG